MKDGNLDKSDISVETILDEINAIGKFHILSYIYICIGVVFTALFLMSYAFTSSDLNYRCQIPVCDKNNEEYNPKWLVNAVPFDDNLPEKCDQYQLTNFENSTCIAESFDKNNILKCNNFIYETDEVTILHEFDLHCKNNKWKLTIVGTIQTFGQTFGISLSGVLSDRFGRRFALCFGMITAAILGIIRTFSWNYVSFIIFEFLQASIGGGAYTSGYILVTELSQQYRSIVLCAFISCFAIGEVFLGVAAMLTQEWKLLIRVTHIPGLLSILYLWIVPESILWLHSKQRYDEVAKTIKRVFKFNNKDLPPSTLNVIKILESENVDVKPVANSLQFTDSSAAILTQVNDKTSDFNAAIKNKTIIMRVVLLSFCWGTNAFVYYGLSLNSISLGNNKYTNFILICLIELPAFVVWKISTDNVGRKKMICTSFLISGLSCVASIFAGKIYWLKLSLFLVGKFGITISFATIYIYTVEIFPTTARQRLFSVCSTCGRIGSMIAPQTPLLATFYKPLPSILFGVTAIIAGLIIFSFPETFNLPLPETLDEALNIGKTKSFDGKQKNMEETL